MRHIIGRIAASLGAVALSFVVVVAGPARPAMAFSGEQVAVKTAMRTVPRAALAVSGAACATGVGCLATGAVMLGILAYSTRDSWLPLVQGIANGGSEGTAGAPMTTGTATAMKNQDGVGHISAQISYANGNPPSTSMGWIRLYVSNVRCLNPGSGVASTMYASTSWSGGVSTQVNTPDASSGTGFVTSPNLCPAGTVLSSANVNFRSNAGWAKEALPLPVVKGAYAPDYHQADASVECRHAVTGETQTIFDTEYGHPERLSVPSCVQRLGPEWVPNHVRVMGGPKGGTSAEQQTIIEVQVKPEVYQDYGDCFNELGLVCKIRVYVDGEPCSPGADGCVNWQRTYDANPQRVKCKFGSHNVDISNCNPLKYAYRVDANPDGDTITDPDTWTPPNPNPEPNPEPEPGGDPIPGSGVNPDAPSTNPNPETNPDTKSCFGEAWSWNPVDWVYVPVKCALLWAFVPKNPPSFSDLPSPLPPGYLPDLSPPSTAGCGPLTFPRFDLGFPGLRSTAPVTFANTCSDPWPLARTITYNGLLLLVLVPAMWTGFKAVTNGVGMGVAPSGGEDD